MINYFYTLSIIMSLQDKTLYFLMSGYLTQPVFCVNMSVVFKKIVYFN